MIKYSVYFEVIDIFTFLTPQASRQFYLWTKITLTPLEK